MTFFGDDFEDFFWTDGAAEQVALFADVVYITYRCV